MSDSPARVLPVWATVAALALVAAGAALATVAGGPLGLAAAAVAALAGPVVLVGARRTRAEQERVFADLRVRERRLTALVEDTADALVVLGPDGTPTVASPSVERILGIGVPELLRTPWEELVHPDDRPTFLRQSAQLTRRRGESTNLELRLRTGGGAFRWVAGRAVNLTEHEDVGGVVVVFQDVGREKAAAAEERTRLSRELHDSVSQALFSMTLQARTAQIALDREGIGPDAPVTRAIGDVAELARGALAEIRALIFELRPQALEQEGFVSALRKHAAANTSRHRVAVDIDAPQDRIPLAPRTEEHLFRIVLEAVANAARHAEATTVRVDVVRAEDPPRVTVTVDDDGRGFDPSTPRPGHFGLQTMRERAAVVGGTLDVHSTHAGTTVVVTVPAEETGTGG